MKANRTDRRGFTLSELLVVIMIVALLVAVLLPYLEGAFATQRLTVCASHLEKIGQAYATKVASGTTKGMFQTRSGAYGWVQDFLAQMNNAQEVFYCPEDAEFANRKSGSLKQLFMTVYHDLNNREGSFDGEISLDEDLSSEFIWRMSGTEFARLEAHPGHGMGFTHTGYVPDGDPSTYWYLFEDMAWQNNPDRDFWDILLRIHHVGDNIEIYVRHGYTGYHHDLVEGTGPNRKVIFEDLKNHVGETHTVPGQGRSSYGLNSVTDQFPIGSNKLLALDYPKTIAAGSPLDLTNEYQTQLVDFWQPDPNHPNDPLSLARHFRKSNVMFANGAVRLIAPDTINPNDVDNQAQYWSP